MEIGEVILGLESMGDPRAVAIWTRFGIRTPDRFLGVNLTKLKEFAKKVKRNHALALELWEAGIHDAKLLATMIEEPKKVDLAQIDRQVLDIHTTDLADKFCSNVVAATPFAAAKMAEWTQAEPEYIKRAGFNLVVALAKNGALDEATAERLLEQVEREIGSERNWVRETMNYAIIALGGVSPAMHEKSVAAAQRIGKVTIDYGETSCKNPDALTVLTSGKGRPNCC